MTIQENVSLKDFTTFRVGGLARYFVRVKSIEDITDALVFAQERNLKIFVLGGGSNIVVRDAGFDGLVIKVEITGVEYKETGEEHKPGNNTVEVMAGAGAEWDALVAETVARGYSGLENLSLIPGTVGAAPVQNIGAYGVEVKNTISWVEAVHEETGEIKVFKKEDLHFAYRNSFFKTHEGRKYIITRVAFTLKKISLSLDAENKTELNTNYRDIAEYIKNNNLLASDITVQKIRDIVIDIRTKKLPSVKDYGTAGSFFKNPIISQSQYEELLKTFPTMPHYPAGESQVKVPAAWILDNVCGFKGYKEGNVGVYKNQALVLVNFGGASAQEVQALAQKMIDAVKAKTGIILEREVEYI